jgi:hypothetical protein
LSSFEGDHETFIVYEPTPETVTDGAGAGGTASGAGANLAVAVVVPPGAAIWTMQSDWGASFAGTQVVPAQLTTNPLVGASRTIHGYGGVWSCWQWNSQSAWAWIWQFEEQVGCDGRKHPSACVPHIEAARLPEPVNAMFRNDQPSFAAVKTPVGADRPEQ